MNQKEFSKAIDLHRIHITDTFWKHEMELVRTEVIPYQWETLNDRVEGAAPSFCMHNFKVAGKMMQEKKNKGSSYEEPVYTFRGFEALPEDPKHLEDKFYGFVFQDSDFAKWIEAVAYSLIDHPDAELEKIADGAIDLVCAAQQENGYLDTYYIINGMDKIFTNLRDHHELYCFGHLAEGAVAYYQATGKDKLLQAVERYADFIDSYFGSEKGKCKGYPGHEIAEMALITLYEVTGKKKYLDLAGFFLDERGKQPYYYDKEHPPVGKVPKIRYHYHQAHIPVRQQEEAVGHAVRAVYLYSGMADMARLSHDEAMWNACKKLWDSIVNEKMYITGGIGGTQIGESFSFPYDLPNDTAYAETCASIGLVFFALRMLQICPDSKYADVMELALHNGILSGMALDGKSFFYVNPLEVLPEACHKDERKFHVKPVRQKWFGCACCPPNLARLLSSIGRYACTENEDTLFVHLYMSSVIEKLIGDTKVEINIKSKLPWQGDVSVMVKTPKAVKMTLALRIPGWCKECFRMPVIEGKNYYVKDGYLYLTGTFHDGDCIPLCFPMHTKAYCADKRVLENEGCIAIKRGPIVYCIEEADNGKLLHRIRLQAQKGFREVRSEEFGVPAVLLEGHGKRPKDDRDITASGTGTRSLQGQISRISQGVMQEQGTGSGLYQEYKVPEYENVSVKLIPYYLWANRGEGEMRVFIHHQM